MPDLRKAVSTLAVSAVLAGGVVGLSAVTGAAHAGVSSPTLTKDKHHGARRGGWDRHRGRSWNRSLTRALTRALNRSNVGQNRAHNVNGQARQTVVVQIVPRPRDTAAPTGAVSQATAAGTGRGYAGYPAYPDHPAYWRPAEDRGHYAGHDDFPAARGPWAEEGPARATGMAEMLDWADPKIGDARTGAASALPSRVTGASLGTAGGLL
ncbi:hypothetical protein Misp01_16170 [Microtetraspora sp. NBRC 13810]|uniref:hypothetical protein n=1 Tax=Microtetraspora sp. NBRC 13810 TaxID=3030990 RepID=UPI0024A10560|nr:hypothetical protein [Microtetraspora sp. NBRC 13810]GLW06487.1 hypothetical protein Misp01_16170 [Microtetraspora sp. NBRC 13810]